MTTITAYQVKKADLDETRLVERDLTELGENEILVAVDRFAITANNVTYAHIGEKFGYWKFFPAEDDAWGTPPAWGFGVVERSNHAEIAEGERLYGFFPMASHLIMAPGRLEATRFFDDAERRRDLPAVYNVYNRLTREFGYDGDMDSERMVLYPLFATSYALSDFLQDQDWFQADRVILTSASSKTAIGLAYAINALDAPPRLVGLTSAKNQDAVTQLNLYNEVLPYDEISSMKAEIATVIVDMAGGGPTLDAIHAHLGDAMKHTALVGVTHRSQEGPGAAFIEDRSDVFFAPAQIEKRAKDWGPGEFEKRAKMFWHQAALKSRSWLSIQEASGADAVDYAWRETLRGNVTPEAAFVVGFQER